ncbi:pentapeptide repeat-containing protein [Streptomyces sp. NPDC001478]
MVRSSGGSGRSGRGAGSGVVGARRPEVRLPPLVAWDGGGLEPDGDYDGVRFEAADLADESGPGSRFMDCALEGCSLDRTELGRARFMDTVLTGVRGVGTDLSGASLRDVEVVDARLGGTQLHGAVLERVLFRGGKIDYLNLRKARLKDVVFEGCVLAEPDFGDAGLTRVEFRDCVLRRADFSAVRMEHVDLRTVAELDIARGVDRLAGAVISSLQLMELAPAFAAQIGVRVED